jgi:hypothetical protein
MRMQYLQPGIYADIDADEFGDPYQMIPLSCYDFKQDM